jgi:hypothetical protein
MQFYNGTPQSFPTSLFTPTPATPDREAIARYIQRYITNFAKNGDPEDSSYEWDPPLPGLPKFPSYESGDSSNNILRFTLDPDSGEATTLKQSDTWFDKKRCGFWEEAPYWNPDDELVQKYPNFAAGPKRDL